MVSLAWLPWVCLNSLLCLDYTIGDHLHIERYSFLFILSNKSSIDFKSMSFIFPESFLESVIFPFLIFSFINLGLVFLLINFCKSFVNLVNIFKEQTSFH